MQGLAQKNLHLAEVYRNLYPWRNINEFVEILKNALAYKSEDNSLIALNKPFGVGCYTINDNNTSKQNQDRILYQLTGSPRYCITDALKPLSDEFKSEKPYQILKGIDRYMSGLILLSNNHDYYRPKFLKALNNSRIHRTPAYGFRAITCGYPLIKSNKIKETVGIELIEVDEFGDYKEPIIINEASRRHVLHKSSNDVSSFQAELEIKQINKEFSVALVELYVSKLRWDNARCYISNKTSFILGDVRFSKRIREILGKPIQVSAFKSSHRYDDKYEPLNSKLLDLLGIRKNASIPLMLDLHAIRLKGFDRKQNDRDLFIQSPYVPLHFALTAEKLNLDLE